jgi:hypothetical protein
MPGNRRRIPKQPTRPAGRLLEFDEVVTKHYGIRMHPGYVSAFTRHRAVGAKFKNNSRVAKAKMEPGDAHQIGALGTVLGSIGEPGIGYVYYVEWDEHPRAPNLIIEDKLEQAE